MYRAYLPGGKTVDVKGAELLVNEGAIEIRDAKTLVAVFPMGSVEAVVDGEALQQKARRKASFKQQQAFVERP